MRTVTATGRVDAPPDAVLATLDPMTIVDAEGTFSAIDREEADGETTVVARGGWMEVAFVFTETDHGYEYEQRGEAGPFETLETSLAVTPEDEGSRVTMQSTVSLGLPLASITDRIAAWKRRGEIKRAIDNIATSV